MDFPTSFVILIKWGKVKRSSLKQAKGIGRGSQVQVLVGQFITLILKCI